MSTATQHPTEKNESVEWNEYASKDATTQALTASPLPHDTPKSVVIRIKRRANPNGPQYWETFKIPYRPNLNIISCLMEIRRNPVNAEGQQSTPVVWEMNCLEQVCGICTMIINGTVRQSCSALVDKLGQPISLEPMTKFPNVRDLVVDRAEMFEHLKRIKAWIEIDGTHDLGPGPRMSQEETAERYIYSRCFTCGCCLEACPQYGDGNYIGAQTLTQFRLFDMHPTGKMSRDERLEGIMGADGVQNCSSSNNCVRVCPMSIPTTRAIYEGNRATVVHGLLGWLRR